MEKSKEKIKVWAITNGYRPVEWGNENLMVYATKKAAEETLKKALWKGCEYKVVPMFIS